MCHFDASLLPFLTGAPLPSKQRYIRSRTFSSGEGPIIKSSRIRSLYLNSNSTILPVLVQPSPCLSSGIPSKLVEKNLLKFL